MTHAYKVRIERILRKFEIVDVWSELKTVTPEMAQEMRTNSHFEDRQRNIKPLNVERLGNIMRLGKFIKGTQIYLGVLPDGRQLILNGNHTLEAIIATNRAEELTLTYCKVENEAEAGAIYAVFDLHARRTWVDSHKGARGGNRPHEKLYLYANNIIAGDFRQREARTGFDTTTADRNLILEKLDDFQEAIALCNTLRTQATPETKTLIWNKAPILAVMLYTAKYKPDLAEEFWGRVVRTEMLTNTMPEQVLLNWIRSNIKRGKSSSWNQTVQARAAAIAWNKAFRGESMSSRKMKPERLSNFFLLGTPIATGLPSLED